MKRAYNVEKLSSLRKIVIASASVSKKKNAIHSFSEVDITKPLGLLEEYKQVYQKKLSFTGYLVACFSEIIKNYPKFNSFISGNKLVILNDITISALIEREINNELIPEPLVIYECQNKGYSEIHEEIFEAKKTENNKFGSISGSYFINFIPHFLLKMFVSLADKNKTMGMKYGKLGITSIGMFSKEPIWFIPHGSATILLTVGSFIDRVVKNDHSFEYRKHLCLTVSFDHDIIDGAPAAGFMNDLIQEIKSGKIIEGEIKKG
jgi:pyruvate/2-oxoglutarate dehydrogenase complex dihydrolipoamide acyltransferase (E2) component